MAPTPDAASPPPQLVDPSTGAVRFLRLGSLAVLGGYAVAIAYRAGILQQVLPASVSRSLESVVDKVKSRTEPLGDASRFRLARGHLLRVYGWASAGMLIMAAGALSFRFMPSVPIALPLATTIVPALLSVAVPRKMMHPAARLFCCSLAWCSAGYTFGPLVWVAQDSLNVFLLLTACTMTGLCVPLFLTRGMISYVVSAQVLSCALSLAIVTTPQGTDSGAASRGFPSTTGARLVLDADVNVLLTLQLFMNLGINLLHTLPTIYSFVAWKSSEAELLDSVDPVRQAFCISVGWAYVLYRSTRACVNFVVRQVIRERRDESTSSSKSSLRILARSPLGDSRTGGVVSSFAMVILYIKAVGVLQKDDPKATLDRLRSVCARVSPVSLILSSSSR